MAQNHIPVHFGVGAATRVDSVLIRWPSGIIQEFDNVPVDRTIWLHER